MKFIFCALLVNLCSSYSFAQADFSNYVTETELTCNNTAILERVELTSQCGEIISQCYPDNYPREVVNGFNVWDVNAGPVGIVTVYEYRFTINDFETESFNGNLDVSSTITFNDQTRVNSITPEIRNISLTGSATSATGVFLDYMSQADENLMVSDTFSIFEQRVFFAFDSSRSPVTSRGFNISYCADTDQCNPDRVPLACVASQAICTRFGFNNYSCICNAGFTGDTCADDVDECNTNPCTANATCTNTHGSFLCDCDSGFSGNGSTNCSDIDECMEGIDNCHADANCTNTEGSFNCTCNDGYFGDGFSCDDVDECDEGTDNCDLDASCSNSVGSFTCICNNGFVGDGTTCDASILLSNLEVASPEPENATTSVLTVNFNIREPWRTDPDYIIDYIVMITDIDTGVYSRNVSTEPVNSTSFVPLTIEVAPFTYYQVRILVGNTGPLFSEARFEYSAGSERLMIESSEIVPAAPTDLMVSFSHDNFIQINWTNPNETNHGPTTEIEVGYVRDTTDCLRFGVNGPDCTETRVQITPCDNPYNISCLQSYRLYRIRVRAYTIVGAGNWSNEITVFTGNLCPSFDDIATLSSCEFTRAAVATPNFPEAINISEVRYWGVDFSGRGGIRTFIEFFNLNDGDDVFFAGPGNLPATQEAVFGMSTAQLTGNLSPGLRTNASFDEDGSNRGFAYFAFRSMSSTAPGFLIVYETNASRCATINPCQNGGICTEIDSGFDFECVCPLSWTGKLCKTRLVTVINLACSSLFTNNFTVTWSVTPEWENDTSLFSGFEILYDGLASPISLPRNRSSYSADGFVPYTRLNVTVSISNSTDEARFVGETVLCVTEEALSETPSSITATSILSSNETSSNISVVWGTPNVPNGEITGYQIDFIQLDADIYDEIPDNRTERTSDLVLSAALDNFKPFRNYSIAVAAINRIGIGAENSTRVRTAEAAPIGPVRTLNVSSIASRTATLTFFPPAFVTGVFRYEVSYIPDPDNGNSSVNASNSPIAITDFTPATAYTFTVVAVTSAGSGPNTSISFETSEDIPSEVRNLSATDITSSNIFINWSAPAQPNGAITLYRIEWSSGETPVVVNTSATMYSITSLSAFTEYRITVNASTAVGIGPGAALTATTLTSAPVGPIRNLSVDADVYNATISIVSPEVITGIFTYDITYGTSDMPDQAIDLNDTETPVTLDGLNSSTAYMITVYPRSAEIRGNFPVSTNFTTVQIPPSKVQNLHFVMVAARTVALEWDEPIFLSGVITNYTVTWFSEVDEETLTVDTNETTLTNLSPFTNYTFVVVANNAAGESPESTLSTITPEAAPVGPIRNLSVDVDVYNATISIVSPEVITGIFTYDITYGTSDMPDQARELNDNDTPVTLDGLTSSTAYMITVYPRSAETRGNFPVSTNFTTVQIPPSKVQNLRFVMVAARTVALEWDEPIFPSGVITNYTVTWFSEVDEETLTVDTNQTTLTNLSPFTNYTFVVVANNAAGESPESTLSTFTPEAGTNECNEETADCHPNATCINTLESFTCTCNLGFSGNGFFCEDIDECARINLCHENASCMNTIGSFLCICDPGFTGNGSLCENIDECTDMNPCHENASCLDTIGSFVCSCNPGFTGDGFICEDIDECERMDICHENASCIDSVGSFVCSCNSGFTGNGLQCSDIDECTDMNPCHENASCLDTIGSFVCSCNPGFTGDGFICEDIDECERMDICHENASCIDSVGSFVCSCNSGFTGNGVECSDIDECTDMNPCHENASCLDTIGSFVCSCNPGFTRNASICENIDECTDMNPCHENASCLDTIGSFVCSCNPGFTGDGFICEDIDECERMDICHENASCTDSVGSFVCSCNSGFTGNGLQCSDMNECEDEDANDCSINANCRNGPGSFSCECNPGFIGDGLNCREGFGQCNLTAADCPPNAGCFNTLEGLEPFMCACNPGFTRNASICENIDECANTNHCHENASCTDTIGSFVCTCNGGFSGNGLQCSDMNECEDEDANNCSINAKCTNEPGSFSCECNPGFIGDGLNCREGFGQCNVATADCPPNAGCFNTLEGLEPFMCACNLGFTRNGSICENIDECANTNHCHENASCTDTFGSFVCTCNGGFSGNGSQCSVILDCTTVGLICDQNAVCLERNDVRACVCNDGYSGNGSSCQWIPQASILCSFSEDTNRYQFSVSSLFGIDCENDEVGEIIANVNFTNITAELLQYTFAALDLATVVRNNQTVEIFLEVIRFLSEVAEFAENLEISLISFQKIVSITDHVLVAQNNFFGQFPIDMGTNLAQSLVTIASSLDLSTAINSSFNSLTPNIAIEVLDRPINVSIEYEPRVYSNLTQGETIQPIVVFIPPEALQRAAELANGSTNNRPANTVRIVNTLQRTSALFSTTELVEWVVSTDLNDRNVDDFNGTVNIVHRTVNLTAGSMPSSSDPFFLTIVNQTCVFWNLTLNEWSTDGCGLVRDSNPPVCKCDHLTHFAILLSIYDIPKNVALETVSMVGCIISIICLAVTIILLLVSPKIRSRRPMNVSLNICSNLLIVYVIFLVGTEERGNIPRCITSTVFLHYFLLSTWFWMAVYAHLLYKSFITVLSATWTNYLLKAYVISYGVPAIIVALNTAIALPLSSNNRIQSPIFGEETTQPVPVSEMLAENFCWLHGYSLYLSFLLPVGLLLIFNIVMFVVVLRKLTWKRKSVSSNMASKQTVRHQLAIAVTIATTLGLVWLLGYFLLFCRNQTCVITMSWLYTVAASLQGLSIFLLYCVKNDEVRNLWWPFVHGMCCSRDGLMRLTSQISNKSTSSSTKSTFSTTKSTSASTNAS